MLKMKNSKKQWAFDPSQSKQNKKSEIACECETLAATYNCLNTTYLWQSSYQK